MVEQADTLASSPSALASVRVQVPLRAPPAPAAVAATGTAGTVAVVTATIPAPAAHRPRLEHAATLTRVLFGMAALGAGVGMMVNAQLGTNPLGVLIGALATHAGSSMGAANIAFMAAALVAWVPLRQRPGIATAADLVVVGPAINLGIWLAPQPELVAAQIGLAGLGMVTAFAGIVAYLSANRGAGAWDGLMVGLGRRGTNLALARTLLEGGALAAGIVLGGPFGPATIAFALLAGPSITWGLQRTGTTPA